MDNFFKPDPEAPSPKNRLLPPAFAPSFNEDDQEEEFVEGVTGVEYEDDRVREDVQPALPQPSLPNLFQHPEAHPFVLDLALMRMYGPEWIYWEPETLEQRIILDFKSKGLSQLNYDKLQAVGCLHMVDLYWDAWTVFSACTQAFSNVPPDFSVIQGITVPQLLISLDVANQIRADMKFDIEVTTYMKVIHEHDGIVCPIAPADGVIEVDASEFGIDCGSIRERWDEVRKSGKAPPSDTVENEQLRRMLEAHQFLEESREQLRKQLPLLYNV